MHARLAAELLQHFKWRIARANAEPRALLQCRLEASVTLLQVVQAELDRQFDAVLADARNASTLGAKDALHAIYPDLMRVNHLRVGLDPPVLRLSMPPEALVAEVVTWLQRVFPQEESRSRVFAQLLFRLASAPEAGT